MKYDTAIIGAGMSGLAAGIRLAHFGKRVLVCDRHFREGGLNSYYEAGGYQLDTGLHAMTNFDPHGPKSAPLKKLLRMLRLRMDDFDFVPQNFSKIIFPEMTLEFANEQDRLLDSVAKNFPHQTDHLLRLIEQVRAYDDGDLYAIRQSARKVISDTITDSRLVEMILCPLQFYGSAEENDIDFWQFVIMFKSIFLEGFCRPVAGVRQVLKILVDRLVDAGGELRLGTGVARIDTDNGEVRGITFDNGDSIECDSLLSSAGSLETFSLCPDAQGATKVRPGQLAYVESINVIDRPVADLGEEATLIFYSADDSFAYRQPDEPIDLRSGVICMPGNFLYGEERPKNIDMVRTTHLANYDHWFAISGIPYMKEKAEWRQKSLAAIAKVTANVSAHIKFSDMFTPATVKRFTGHINGVVYGSPDKIKNGRTAINNLYLCGTDQGYLGIVGSMLSGVVVSNAILLDEG